MNIIKLLNISADKRTAKNFAVFPIIIFVRIPLVLIILLGDWLDNYYDYIPAWDSN